jgi:hypothetical protein
MSAPVAPLSLRALLPLLPALALFGCRQDIGLTQSARCDGIQQPSEDWVDQAFDRDGDGFYDGSNADCINAYPADKLDCEDTIAAVNPTATEVACNELDDDCDPATADSSDNDGDGFAACDDCDDTDPLVNPQVAETACNFINDDCDEATADGYDADGDGFDSCLDCDDTRPYISPDASEVFCNSLDDDCNPSTFDFEDRDGDGSGSCDDCNDGDPTISPLIAEDCDTAEDDNCDGQANEDCAIDWSGQYTLDKAVSKYCAYGLINFSFGVLEISSAGTSISAFTYPYTTPPGTMTGSVDADGNFSATVTYKGGCTEVYTVTGVFTSDTTFTASFSAAYSGSSGACGFGTEDCSKGSPHTWIVNGTRK